MAMRPHSVLTHSTQLQWRAFPSKRTFLSFPFSGSSSWDKPQTYHERKLFLYNQKELYDIVSDVSLYPRFVPFCTSSRVVKPPSRSSQPGATSYTMEAELTVGFLQFTEKYTSRVTCIPYKSVQAVAASSTPLFKTLSTTWRFEPALGGISRNSDRQPRSQPTSQLQRQQQSGVDQANKATSTWVSLDLEYGFTNPLHATVSAAFFGQVSKLMVKAFEDRCAEIYGSRTS
ncbi:hypothetical protein BDN72DRAFT_954485 [Pluteus cervinus]|uniref:Uncharacterized protein n=1 Tax=Pluteus cervinus TaxID=181527 RepID=A0ACD3BD78_9AGAR|nr:hypothetical protein BDN72DRAFT_954485 [Pluteus cervinus]